MNSCPVCDNEVGNRSFTAREMMFGTLEPFAYVECAECRCLWLPEPPKEMSAYYGSDYYSLSSSPLRSWVRRNRAAYIAANLVLYRRPPSVPPWWPDVPPRLDIKLLDVGSGAGNFLFHLKHLGFTSLQGIDPYVPTSVRHRGGPTIWKRSLADVDERFDAIVFNHSLEHMAHPRQVFDQLAQILAPNGWAMIRTPVASSFAHRTYGADWVQIDAPRHLVVHTTKSISILAQHAGLRLDKVLYDSTEFQFWGSEQYRVGIPLTSRRSYGKSRRLSQFSRSQVQDFAARSRELNRLGDGDQACFQFSLA